MIVRVMETWPSQSTLEVDKKYSELAKNHWPRFSKITGFKMVPSGGNIKAYIIYEIAHGKESIGVKELTQMFSELSRIPGYEYEIR